MKPVALLVLIAIAGCLAALIYFQPGTTPPKAGTAILEFDPTTIKRVQLRNQNATMVFVQQDTLWVMESPEAAPAVQEHVGALILLATIPSSTNYSLDGLDLEQFKLDNPLNQLQLDDHTLSFGGMDPIKNKRYVATGSTLHLIDTAITGILFKPHTFFIEPEPGTE